MITTKMNMTNTVQNRLYRFLFVDDSPTDNKYLSLLIRIKKLPIQPHFEYSPQSALSYLLSCKPEQFPEVIMVDINMPLMNGFEFVDRYVEHFKNRKDTILYITSSSIQLSDKEKTEKNPYIKDFIDKPFNLKQFEEKILPQLRLKDNS